MAENLTFSPPEPPPAHQLRVWIWAAAAITIIVCSLLFMIGIPLSGFIVAGSQLSRAGSTQQAHSGATQTSAAASAQPPPGWQKIIGEIFDSNINHWDVRPYDTYAAKTQPMIKDGRYVYQVDHMINDDLFDSEPAVALTTSPDQLFLAVEARQLGGSTGDNAYGLRFRVLSREEYSTFEVQDNGYISVNTFSENNRISNIPWTREASVRPGEFNRLVILTDQSGYIFLVNNQFVGRVNNLPIEGGQVGVFIYGRAPKGVTYEFDNFQLYVPQQP